MKVIFVCTSNLFRSVSAHSLFQKYLDDNRIKNIVVDSAGIYAEDGRDTSMNIISCLKEFKIDTIDHVSKPLTQELVDSNDIVISMSTNHRTFIENNFNTRSPLFNEIAFGELTGLLDNNEVPGLGSAGSVKFNNFEKETIDYIAKAIPKLYENINKFKDYKNK